MEKGDVRDPSETPASRCSTQCPGPLLGGKGSNSVFTDASNACATCVFRAQGLFLKYGVGLSVVPRASVQGFGSPPGLDEQ